MREQFDRERAKIATKPVAAEDGSWSAEIEAVTTPTVGRGEGHVVVTAQFEAATPVRCYVYDGPIDVGGSVQHMLQAISPHVEVKSATVLALEVVNHTPVVFVRAIYHKTIDGRVNAGDLKIGIAPTSNYPVMCVHDAPGYAQSFADAMLGFVGSLKHGVAERSPKRSEIWRMSLNGADMGFMQTRIYDEADGTTSSVTLSASLLPAAPGVLRTSDEANVLKIGKDGTLASGMWIEIENLDTAVEVQLERDGNAYRYEGTFKGKPISGNFETKAGLEGDDSMRRRLLASIADGKRIEFVQDQYLPGLAPTQATEVKYGFQPSNSTLTSEMGALRMLLEVDEQGNPTSMMIPVGGSELIGTLIDETGE